VPLPSLCDRMSYDSILVHMPYRIPNMPICDMIFVPVFDVV
jgi:hypothetical protein